MRFALCALRATRSGPLRRRDDAPVKGGREVDVLQEARFNARALRGDEAQRGRLGGVGTRNGARAGRTGGRLRRRPPATGVRRVPVGRRCDVHGGASGYQRDRSARRVVQPRRVRRGCRLGAAVGPRRLRAAGLARVQPHQRRYGGHQPRPAVGGAFLPAPRRRLPHLRPQAHLAYRQCGQPGVQEDQRELVVRPRLRMGVAGVRPQRRRPARQRRRPLRVSESGLPADPAARRFPELLRQPVHGRRVGLRRGPSVHRV